MVMPQTLDRADEIIAEALGYDLDHDPDYNPKGEKEDDDYIDLHTKNCLSCQGVQELLNIQTFHPGQVPQLWIHFRISF